MYKAAEFQIVTLPGSIRAVVIASPGLPECVRAAIVALVGPPRVKGRLPGLRCLSIRAFHRSTVARRHAHGTVNVGHRRAAGGVPSLDRARVSREASVRLGRRLQTSRDGDEARGSGLPWRESRRAAWGQCPALRNLMGGMAALTAGPSGSSVGSWLPPAGAWK